MKKVERRVNESFSKTAPDGGFGSVKQDCDALNVNRTAAKAARRNNSLIWKIATFALAFVLVVTSVVGVGIYAGGNALAATVALDVNPSIQLQINSKQRVKDVTALNADGALILGTMDLENVQLEVAVNAIIGSMMRNGYLTDLANSVLVSVDAKQDMYNSLVQLISDTITLKLKEQDISASVLSQSIVNDDAARAVAKQYGISVGKAQLVNKIAAKNSAYTVEQLAKLTINELNLLLNNETDTGNPDVAPSPDVNGGDITQSGGSASQKGYIGNDAALQRAIDYLGIEGLTAQTVTALRVKMDFDDGFMIYEIEFVFGETEYDIEVEAISGEVLSCERDLVRRPVTPTDTLTQQQVVDMALQLAGAPQDGSVNVYVERDIDDGVEQFELTFEWNNIRYEYEIDCYGNVLCAKQKPLTAQDTGDAAQQLKKRVCEQLSSYGVTEANVFEWECELDDDSPAGVKVYEIEFKCDGYEYECKVDESGTILKWERERD